MINNLKPPFQAISGTVCDADGAVILKANRESETTPLRPVERDELIHLIVDLLNKEFPIMKEPIKESLNEAQLGDKVQLGKEKGYLIGQTSDGQWIVQIQGNTKFAKDKDVKVLRGLAQNVTQKPPMKFDDKTQKLLFEQFIHCGVFYGNVPIKTANCYVRYSDYIKAADNANINVLIEGELSIMPKNQVRLFENPNDFANPQDYVEAVMVDEESGEALANIMVHAGDYSQAIGDADAVRVIINNDGEPQRETLPKGRVRTLSV